VDKFGSASRIRTDARLINTAIQIGKDHLDASYRQSKPHKRQARSPGDERCSTSDLSKSRVYVDSNASNNPIFSVIDLASNAVIATYPQELTIAP